MRRSMGLFECDGTLADNQIDAIAAMEEARGCISRDCEMAPFQTLQSGIDGLAAMTVRAHDAPTSHGKLSPIFSANRPTWQLR